MQNTVYAPTDRIAGMRPRASFTKRAFGLVRRQPLASASAVLIVAAAAAAILAPYLGLPDPALVNMSLISQPPSPAHLLGTDYLGRDQLTRVLHGGRITLMVGIFGVLLGTSAGWAWGVVSGYAGGKFDGINQRFVEIVLAIPTLLLAFVLAAVLGQGLGTAILAIAILNVGQVARVIRAVTLTTREAEYVAAARAIGAKWPRVVIFHVTPTTIAPFLVMFSAQVGLGITVEATLGFLGIGVPPPAPSWGALVAEPLKVTTTPPWWLIVIPGMVVALVVLAFNMVGDALRDELDPRLRGSQ